MISNLGFSWVEREHLPSGRRFHVHNRIVMRQGKFFLSQAINPKLATTEYGEREISKSEAVKKMLEVINHL